MTFDQIFFTVLIRMGQIYNTDRSVLQELGKLWRMSDCEELVGLLAGNDTERKVTAILYRSPVRHPPSRIPDS